MIISSILQENFSKKGRIMISKKLTNIISDFTTTEGYSDTYIEEVSLFRAEKQYKNIPLVYDQSICVSIQGRKFARMSNKTLEYDPDHFLVVPGIVPFNCDTESSLDKPYLGINIAIDFFVVQGIMDELGEGFSNAVEIMNPQSGIYLESTSTIAEPLSRLIESLRTKGESAILGKQILREIYYSGKRKSQGV